MEHKVAITKEELQEIFEAEAPFVLNMGFRVDEVGYGTCRCVLPLDERNIRPGNTVSGPAMFSLADFSMWVALLGAIGRVPLAVTSDMSIRFLRRPGAKDIIADVRLPKIGRRLAVGDVWLHADGEGEPCAHATGTYVIPQQQT